MKIGVLGTGNVGLAIAGACLKIGYQVKIGTNHPSKPALQAWLSKQNAEVQLGKFSEAAIFGDIIFLCTNWLGTQAVIESAGVWNFNHKIVVDITNPLDGKGPDENGKLHLALHNSLSAGEQVQAWLPGAHVVKALNTIGSDSMLEPKFNDGPPTMFICGNDKLAKQAVADILKHWGWADVIDLGNIEFSRELEALCVIWCAYGFRTGTWHHAFKLIRD